MNNNYIRNLLILLVGYCFVIDAMNNKKPTEISYNSQVKQVCFDMSLMLHTLEICPKYPELQAHHRLVNNVIAGINSCINRTEYLNSGAKKITIDDDKRLISYGEQLNEQFIRINSDRV